MPRELDPKNDRERSPFSSVEGLAPAEEFAPYAPAEERKIGRSMLSKVALAAVVVAALVITISQVMVANQLKRESAELESRLDDYNEKIRRLVYYINKEVDDEYIIEYAREYLDMYFPDEEIDYNDVNG